MQTANTPMATADIQIGFIMVLVLPMTAPDLFPVA
jgi:hypothetical protein